jgi:hypothetical protein
MADSMTNVEIEDVLSSIRRLVSQETTVLKARKPERLMLTPAFRVVDAEPAAAPAAAPVSLEERIAALEAQIGGSAEEFEPDGSEDLGQHIPQAVIRAARPEPAPVPVAAPEELTQAEVAPAEAEVAPAPAEVAQAEVVPEEARGNDADAPSGAFVLRDLASADVIVLTVSEPQPGPEVADAAPPSVEAEAVTAPEAAEQMRSDAAAVAEMKAEDDAWLADNIAAPPAARRGDGAPVHHVEEALIDEAALREIVASLVREELRGELGERITRNVRRLIRREIHRALALQGLAEDDED